MKQIFIILTFLLLSSVLISNNKEGLKRYNQHRKEMTETHEVKEGSIFWLFSNSDNVDHPRFSFGITIYDRMKRNIKNNNQSSILLVDFARENPEVIIFSYYVDTIKMSFEFSKAEISRLCNLLIRINELLEEDKGIIASKLSYVFKGKHAICDIQHKITKNIKPVRLNVFLICKNSSDYDLSFEFNTYFFEDQVGPCPGIIISEHSILILIQALDLFLDKTNEK